MTRKKIREHLFVMLFRVDFHQKEELAEQAAIYMEEMENASKTAKAEIQDKFYAVVEHMAEIDAQIEEKSRGWDLKRLAKADVTILRLAVYEILFDKDVPNGVAINEAVELSKKYGTDKSTSFINGVLASVAREFPEENAD
ncbi:MAG: transcription antitermination factor NusB [Lachnospiraceae bacterium]|nr:transcription antitermination factor NusB [Lachnospiraceae bacterium]